MTESVTISRDPPESPAQDYSTLRENGLEEIQQRGAETWTDHNLHDPGITIMEAFCYAMTELGLKLDLGMPDLIASGESRAAPALPAASTVLPCGAVTAQDLLGQMIDHYLVGDARISTSDHDTVAYYEDTTADPPLTYTAPATDPVRITPRGLYDVLLAFDDPLLNANTYSIDVIVGLDTISLECALPHWDEPEATPFLDGGLTLTGATMTPAATPWNSLELDRAWYGRVDVSHTGPGGAATDQIWVVMRISNAPELPASSIPPILAAATAAVESIAAGSVLSQFLQRVSDASTTAVTVRRDLRNWRNLCEDVHALSVSRVQDIAINARIEVTRTTGLEALLAAILYDIDQRLAPPNRFAHPDELRKAGLASEDILDGPLLSHGVPAKLDIEPILRGDTVFLSDVLNLLTQPHPELHDPAETSGLGLRDVAGVTELSLSNFVNNRVITSGATDCLRLIDIDRHRPRLSIAKSRIVLVHDEIEVAYDVTAVVDMVEAARAQDAATALLPDYDPEPALPVGEDLEVGAYHPFQFDLPSIYGVTETGLPASATTERRQQALQLRAYLLIMEQFLADTTEQLASINRLFSPDPDETTTYATRALVGLDDMEKLVAAFPGGDWLTFAADPDNAYAAALRTAAEDPATALDRRNRMLDHLLARHGEDMISWAQDLMRAGLQSVSASALPALTLPERMAERRLAISRHLLRAKSEFLADVPRLHALRLLGFGGPLHWLDDLVTITETAPGQYTWQILRDGTPIYETPGPASTRGEALTRARDALYLATSGANVSVVNMGPGNRRYVLRASPSAPMAAQSAFGFPTVAAANTAATAARRYVNTLTREQSRTAMERRIDHQIGARDRTRRTLLTPLDDFFEVFDDGPAFTKRWQLWSDPGFLGDVLLVSTNTFVDPVEGDAIAAAETGVEATLEVALDDWNWQIDDTNPAAVTLDLLDIDGVTRASAPAPFPSRADAEAAQTRAITQLYRSYSAEGFHMVEPLLLRPAADGERFLDLPSAEEGVALSDPYSQRLVIVLPSGWERDFSVGPESRAFARPHRFRAPEFRRHAERMIRQSCPAHIVPEIRWVDRAAPNTPTPSDSFDRFERRYFRWLDTAVLDGFSDAATSTRRDELIRSVNAIMNS